MTTREALIAAIAATPGDDLPRLVAADWFEENGEPERAEFVRLQVEARRIEDREERLAVIARGNVLFRAHGREWFAPLLSTLDPVGPKCDYRMDAADHQCQTDINGYWWEGRPASAGERDTEERAFVSAVSVENGFANKLVLSLSTLPKGCDSVRALRLEPITALSASLSFDGQEWERFTCPELARVGVLTVYGEEGSEWRTLFADPNLSSVWRLGVYQNRHFDEPEYTIPPAVVRELHASPLGQRVKFLDLVLNDECLRALSESGELALETLSLMPAWQYDWGDGATAFLNSPAVHNLKSLEYIWGSVGDDALVAIGRGTGLRRLEHLSINLDEVTERGLRALAEAEVMTRLKMLSLNFQDRPDPPTDETLRGLLHLQNSNPDFYLSLCFQSARNVPPFLREKFGDRVSK